MRLITNTWLTGIALLVTLGLTSMTFAEDGFPTAWDPFEITTGNLAGSTVVVFDLTSSGIQLANLSGPDYAAARLFSSTRTLTYEAASDWTATFDPPVENLLLYVVGWRGSFGGPAIVTYDFDQPFVVLSGLNVATVSNGNTRLSIPDANGIFAEGILQFTGPVSSLSVETNADNTSFQNLTFGVFRSAVSLNIPTLSEWGMIAMAGILGIIGFMVVRRRQMDGSRRL
jgi:hypothetical protein